VGGAIFIFKGIVINNTTATYLSVIYNRIVLFHFENFDVGIIVNKAVTSADNIQASS
jgi:hypothetical protein